MRTILACAILAGCSTTPTPADETRLAANLLQLCPPMEALTGVDGKAVIKWATYTVALYEDCRARHGELVKAVKSKD